MIQGNYFSQPSDILTYLTDLENQINSLEFSDTVPALEKLSQVETDLKIQEIILINRREIVENIVKYSISNVSSEEKAVREFEKQLDDIKKIYARVSKHCFNKNANQDSLEIDNIEWKTNQLPKDLRKINQKEIQSLLNEIKQFSKKEFLSEQNRKRLKSLHGNLQTKLEEIREVVFVRETIVELLETDLNAAEQFFLNYPNQEIKKRICREIYQYYKPEQAQTDHLVKHCFARFSAEMIKSALQFKELVILEDLKNLGDLGLLPNEVLFNIFSRLDKTILSQLFSTCKDLAKLADNDQVWLALIERDFPQYQINKDLTSKENYLNALALDNMKKGVFCVERLLDPGKKTNRLRMKKWGECLVLASYEGYIQFLDKKGKLIDNFKASQDHITSIGIWENILITADHERNIHFYDLCKKELTNTIKTPASVDDLEVVNNSLVLVDRTEKVIWTYDIQKNQWRQDPIDVNFDIKSFNIEGHKLLFEGVRNSLSCFQIFDLKNRKAPEINFNELFKEIKYKNNQLFYIYKGSIFVYDIEKEKITALHTPSENYPEEHTAFELIDNFLISASHKGTIKIWDLQTLTCLVTEPLKSWNDSSITSCIFTGTDLFFSLGSPGSIYSTLQHFDFMPSSSSFSLSILKKMATKIRSELGDYFKPESWDDFIRLINQISPSQRKRLSDIFYQKLLKEPTIQSYVQEISLNNEDLKEFAERIFLGLIQFSNHELLKHLRLEAIEQFLRSSNPEVKSLQEALEKKDAKKVLVAFQALPEEVHSSLYLGFWLHSGMPKQKYFLFGEKFLQDNPHSPIVVLTLKKYIEHGNDLLTINMKKRLSNYIKNLVYVAQKKKEIAEIIDEYFALDEEVQGLIETIIMEKSNGSLNLSNIKDFIRNNPNDPIILQTFKEFVELIQLPGINSNEVNWLRIMWDRAKLNGN